MNNSKHMNSSKTVLIEEASVNEVSLVISWEISCLPNEAQANQRFLVKNPTPYILFFRSSFELDRQQCMGMEC